MQRCEVAIVLGLALGGLAIPAFGQPDPSGIDFVTIGAPGNAPNLSANPNDFVHNRGGVGYEYRIGRMEVTTAQFVEFFNAAFDRPEDDQLPHLIPPDFWGAVGTTPNTSGAQRWAVPVGNELMPVGNISWRMAAMYTNWLHNDKSADRSAFLSGAYDVSTFGFSGNVFTDQMAHSPGARYWIPTWDEWLKASHFDPNRNGTGGWWQYSNGSDTPYVYGPPGVLVNGMPTQANAGWDDRDFPGFNPFGVPLGSYASISQSPWGLYDVAGGSTEWTESIRTLNDGRRYRIFDGSYRSEDAFSAFLDDDTSSAGAEFPHVSSFEFGLRVATVIPSPASGAVGVGAFILLSARRRRVSAPTGREYHTFTASPANTRATEVRALVPPRLGRAPAPSWVGYHPFIGTVSRCSSAQSFAS